MTQVVAEAVSAGEAAAEAGATENTVAKAEASALTQDPARPPERSPSWQRPPRRFPPCAIAPKSPLQTELHEAIQGLGENCATAASGSFYHDSCDGASRYSDTFGWGERYPVQ